MILENNLFTILQCSHFYFLQYSPPPPCNGLIQHFCHFWKALAKSPCESLFKITSKPVSATISSTKCFPSKSFFVLRNNQKSYNARYELCMWCVVQWRCLLSQKFRNNIRNVKQWVVMMQLPFVHEMEALLKNMVFH